MPIPEYGFDVSLLLQPDAELPWAAWYATPLMPDAATALHAQSRQALQRALTSGSPPLATWLAALVAGFWLGRPVALEYRSLIATLPPESRARVELVYGQLLISRKLTGALEHLGRGFMLAIPQLAPGEYFALLRRHETLRALPLADTASAPQTLADLLTEARVIRRLQPAGHRPTSPPHDDTLG